MLDTVLFQLLLSYNTAESIVYVVSCHGLLLFDLEIGKPGVWSCHHCWPLVVGKLSRWKGGVCEEVSGRYLVRMEVCLIMYIPKSQTLEAAD